MARVVVGVGAGIAAYKTCELVRRLRETGHDVAVVPTAASLEFVGRVTWEALSGQPVHTEVFSDVPSVAHVRLGHEADLVVVAPATADLIGRAAHGLADDLLTNTLLTARCPVVFAPAMHAEMWTHPATVENVATLRRRGALVVDPAVGRLTGKDSGPGRLPEAIELFQIASAVLARGRVDRDLVGLRVVVSAGGTREYLDPVRFLGNRSSGKQGIALARAAALRGADVTLVAANASVALPSGMEVRAVGSASELADEMLKLAATADAVVMAAAPADFRPISHSAYKIKKRNDGVVAPLELAENPDILAGLVAERAGRTPVLVGFAAETGDESGSVLDHARRKLARKGCDLLVVNDVSDGSVFGQDDNKAVILSSDGLERDVPRGSKAQLADVIWDVIAERLSGTAGQDRRS